MDYEKVIVELLSRIQTLEEQVTVLMAQQDSKKEKAGEKVTTEDIRQYIKQLKIDSKAAGKEILILTDCMNDDDIILFQPPKGNSSTLEIEYRL